MSKPAIESSVERLHGECPDALRDRAPTERSEANGTISRAGNARSRSRREHQRADLAGRADDGYPITL